MGPTRLGPLLRAVSAASTMARVDGPPEPMMMPVRSLRNLASLRGRRRGSPGPWPHGSMPFRRRGTAWRGDRPPLRNSAWARHAPGSESQARRICPRCTMPDFASRSDASTSWVLLPMDETMPIPVTTTRLMPASCACGAAGPRRQPQIAPPRAPRLGHTWPARGNPARPENGLTRPRDARRLYGGVSAAIGQAASALPRGTARP